MSITNYPNGVSSFGMPLVGTTTGSVFFVHHSGSNGNSGTDSDNPFASIDYAIGRCTDSKGDIIYVMPGHAETIITAGGITCDVIGVSIIGMGNGRNRPTISVSTSTGVDMEIDAANVTVDNLVFDLTGVDAVAAFFDIDAADFTLKNCDIIMADTAGQATAAVLAAGAAHRMTIENNIFRSAVTAGSASAIDLGSENDVRIIGNEFDGHFTGGVIYTNDTPLRMQIRNNQITNLSAGIAGIVLGATGSGVTGMVANNNIFVADSASYTAQAVTQLGGATGWFQNFIAVYGEAEEGAVASPTATYSSA